MSLVVVILCIHAAILHVAVPQQCTTEIEKCKELRFCLNGGTCQLVHSDNCTIGCACPKKYRGTQCEYTQCANGIDCFQGHCVGFGVRKWCMCTFGWYGQHCNETYKICDQGVRCHKGSCLKIGSVMMCACKSGYIGKNCDVPCSCKNGGTCTRERNLNVCFCKDGYYGKRCESEGNMTRCRGGLDCYNGRCVDSGMETFENCQCEHGWTGIYCKRPCLLRCLNGGYCYYNVGSQGDRCACPYGYMGSQCQYAKATTTTTKPTKKPTEKPTCKGNRASGSIMSLLSSLVPVYLALK